MCAGVTGYFEVTVDGKLVHSKRVSCLKPRKFTMHTLDLSCTEWQWICRYQGKDGRNL